MPRSDVDLLRAAAALMRSRAEAASATSPGAWNVEREPGIGYVVAAAGDWACEAGDQEGAEDNAEHIASWHPPVALAVADWLDVVASYGPPAPGSGVDALRAYRSWVEAVTVARTYLGRDA